MSAALKPRSSDVARWVAKIAEPPPSRYFVHAFKEHRRDVDKARGMLRSWGLGDDGMPLSVALAAGKGARS